MAWIPTVPRNRAHRVAVGAVLVIALALLAALTAAVQAERVHNRYGVWALGPGAHPPVIRFGGRNYDRGGRVQSLPADVDEVGSGPSGGDIFSTPVRGETPTVVYVRCPDGTVFSYGLSGGP